MTIKKQKEKISKPKKIKNIIALIVSIGKQ